MLTDAPIVPYIPVSDVARARKFVFMYPSAGAGSSRASTAFWAVDDVTKEVAELKARGVKFEDYDIPGIKTVDSIATGGGAKTAWFKDTEGNILAISQRL